jgi:hypothetical protein
VRPGLLTLRLDQGPWQGVLRPGSLNGAADCTLPVELPGGGTHSMEELP